MPERGMRVGPYRIGHQIGRGTFGVVYMCKHHYTKISYAAKFIYKHSNPDITIDPRKIFDVETSAMRQITHLDPSFQHIIKLHYYTEHQDAYIMIMDLAVGGDLETKYILPAVSCELSELKLGMIMFDVVLALRRLHDMALVHRDIKPGNILLLTHAEDSRLALCDFGFCRDCRDTSPTTRQGTAEFMAPEVHARHEVAPAVDMWALGITMFNLWFRTFPWQPGADRYQIRDELLILEEEWLWLADTLSHAGSDFMYRCLILDPRRRITAREAFAHPFLFRARTARGYVLPGDAHAVPPPPGITAEERSRRMYDIREGSRFLWK